MRFSLTRKSKLTIILAVSAFILFLGILGGYIFWNDFSFNWTKYTVESPRVTINYPKVFERTYADKDEAESRNRETLFRAVDGGSIKVNPFVVALSKETGLRIAASLSRADIVPMLLRNIERAYPLRFPEFSKLSEKNLELGDRKAAEIYFTYMGPAGEKIKQRMMIVEYDGDTALYLSAQAKEKDFDGLNRKYFQGMFAKLKFGD